MILLIGAVFCLFAQASQNWDASNPEISGAQVQASSPISRPSAGSRSNLSDSETPENNVSSATSGRSEQSTELAQPALKQVDSSTATDSKKEDKDKLSPKPADLSQSLRQAVPPVAQLLQQYHFAKQPLDEARAARWIKAYMEALDYNHMIFYQGDLDLFVEKFAHDLPQRTLRGDTRVAFQIFYAFKQRLDERMQWVFARLKKPFDLTKEDHYEIDRSQANWPKDMADANALWERRLKFDLLQEKMTALSAAKAQKKEQQNNDANSNDKDENGANENGNGAQSNKETKEGKGVKSAEANGNKKPLKSREAPEQAILKRYERFQKNAQEYDAEDLIQTYLSALASLYDPHSQYMSPTTLDDFAINMKLELVGIGAVLSSEDGYCTIREIIPGGPADLDKRLQVNDKIIAVGQGASGSYLDIVDMKLRNAVKLIRGEKGTIVRLKIIPSDAGDLSARKEISLVRDKIELTAQQANAQIIDQEKADGTKYRLGVIELPSFYGEVGTADGETPSSSSTADVELLIEELKKHDINGLVLDLRRNGGGLLDEAISLTGLFIGKGPVVQVRDQNGNVKVRSSTQKTPAYTGPLIVLTSRNSASASEIVAGALQNYNRAIIVGDKSTHGKGTVQAVVELARFMPPITFGGNRNARAGALKLTIQKFYLPNGHSTQNRGVVPDISLPSLNDYLKIGEADAPNALPWDEIRSSRFRVMSLNPPGIIELLHQRSNERVEKSPIFGLIAQDIVKVRERLESGKISLVESKRIEEKKIEEARRDKLKEFQKEYAPKEVKLSYYIIKQGDNKRPRVEETDKPLASLARRRSLEPDEEEQETEDPQSNSYMRDVYLQETINIFTDWLDALKQKTGTLKSVSGFPFESEPNYHQVQNEPLENQSGELLETQP